MKRAINPHKESASPVKVVEIGQARGKFIYIFHLSFKFSAQNVALRAEPRSLRSAPKYELWKNWLSNKQAQESELMSNYNFPSPMQ